MLTLIAFLAVILPFYFLQKSSLQQNLLIILMSLGLYCAIDWHYLLIFVANIALNYCVLRLPWSYGRWKLGMGIGLNIGFLVLFKYLPANIALLGTNSFFANYILPIGLSFYSLQAISAHVDLYRERAQVGFMSFIVYMTYFPQVLMGPIIRYKYFVPQIGHKKFDFDHFEIGLYLIVYGMMHKMVFADNLSHITSWLTYPQFLGFHGVNLMGMLVAEYVKCYADFFGYSIVAVGVAKLLGHDIILNFNRPFRACSMRELWRRWHISLSLFLREYLYIPLGGSHRQWLRVCANLLAVFVVSGIWHGVTANFILWGLFHGMVVVCEYIFVRVLRLKIPEIFASLFGPIYTFMIFSLSMAFFRLPNFHEVTLLFSTCLEGSNLTIDLKQLFLLALFTVPVFSLQYVKHMPNSRNYRYIVLGVMLFIIYINLTYSANHVYMRF